MSVRATRSSDALELLYTLEGTLQDLLLPAPTEGELWQHTCFEIFLRASGMPSYLELNFSPRGVWRAYSFTRYREREGLDHRLLDVRVAAGTAGSDRLELQARVGLAPLGLERELTAAMATVVEERDGTLSYWALKHPAPKPDFHHPDSFTARLDAVRH